MYLIGRLGKDSFPEFCKGRERQREREGISDNCGQGKGNKWLWFWFQGQLSPLHILSSHLRLVSYARRPTWGWEIHQQQITIKINNISTGASAAAAAVAVARSSCSGRVPKERDFGGLTHALSTEAKSGRSSDADVAVAATTMRPSDFDFAVSFSDTPALNADGQRDGPL